MRRLIDRCAGNDVGQVLLVVCVRVVRERGELLFIRLAIVHVAVPE
jgi:hypothetical protein